METTKLKKLNKTNSRQSGFSYIEVMIAMVVFMVGILGMTGALLANRVHVQIIEKQVVAKQIGLSTLESILTTKELQVSDTVSGWDLIGNVGSNPVDGTNQGVFETGFRPIRESPGEDGIIGTDDDACTGLGTCGTNSSPVSLGYERKIVITDIPNTAFSTIRQRRVEVTIKYLVNKATLEEVFKTTVTDYR